MQAVRTFESTTESRRRFEGRSWITGIGIFLACSVLPGVKLAGAQVVPLHRAHAHNDYEHDRPLLEALERGFMSVEADIYLVDGELLVAHDVEDIDPHRTLESLYLAPLEAHVRSHGGRVYENDDESLILLIDIKSEAGTTYRALQKRLEAYSGLLTRFTTKAIEPGAVTIVISGNRPRELMKDESERWAAYDGRLDDLEADMLEPVSFIPLVSSNWNAVARWYGQGELPAEARSRLNAIVEKAHAQGRKLRFWATTDNPAVWEVIYEAGVDFLNADDLAGLQRFLLGKQEGSVRER